MSIRANVLNHIAEQVGIEPEQVVVTDRYIQMSTGESVFVLQDGTEVRLSSQTMSDLSEF